jgi:hypothetical protein
VAVPPPEAFDKSSCRHPNRARAARICADSSDVPMSAIDRLQFVTMVGLIRETERAVDDGIKAPQKCDIPLDRARIRRCEAALTMDPTQ